MPRDYVLLSKQALVFGVEDIISYQGYVVRSHALEIQQRSDILLLLTWNTTKESGVNTGKLMEYIGMNRPILALIAGDRKGSDVTDILHKTGLGSSYYYLDKENARNMLKAHLLIYIDQKNANGFISCSASKTDVDYYSYEKIGERLLVYLDSLSHSIGKGSPEKL